MSDPVAGGRRGPLDRAAALSWRFLLIVAALVVLGIVLARLELVVVPVVVALLVAVVVTPAAAWIERRGLGHTLGAALVYLAAIAAIAALLVIFTPRFLAQFGNLSTALGHSLDSLRSWLVGGPLHLSPARVDSLMGGLRGQVTARGGFLQNGLLSGATTAAKVVGGGVVALILSFFFVKDGPQLWGWILLMLPAERRADVDAVGRRAWRVLGQYLLGSAFNGAVEAAIIAATLLLLGTPLVLPLALLQFSGAFFPLVGAVVAGGVAVLVTLASGGLGHAVILLIVVILVHQLEGNVLAPLILGHAVRLHPVVVLIVLTAGGILGGIVGAFVAVPVTAVVWGVVKELVQRDVIEPPGEVEPLLDEPAEEPPLAVDKEGDGAGPGGRPAGEEDRRERPAA